MARVQIPFAVQDSTGAALTGASVNVKVRDTATNAVLYADETSATLAPNPVTTVNGAIPAWVNPGSYDLIITGASYSGTRTFEAVRGDTGLSTKTFRIAHTWHIPGVVAVETGSADLVNYILPFYVSTAPLETTSVVGYRCSLGTGTSATVKIQKNGIDLTGFTGIAVTTTDSGAYPTPQPAALNDKLKLIVTAVSGSPGNLALTLFVEHTG